ncbi:PRTase-like protein [Hesseltinella vesiculosa]|uniref:PRTase-like protein n=1 Tax=Hesseltinella vesiculosa TaxID=101127 RepID=A0A1X2G6D3_9FUNG|nr:PRTase-like protein [Hesseltinella vesiculosa]
MATKRYITYNEVHKDIQNAVKKFRLNDDFQPDLIVSIAAGGLAPARFLRTFLNKVNGRNVPIQVIGLSLYEELEIAAATGDTRPVEVTKTQWLNFAQSELSLLGRRILIVDEVDDSRMTMAYAVQEIQKDIEAEEIKQGMQPGESNTKIGVFVLHNKNKPKKRQLPDEIMKNYYAAVDLPDQWCVYPWDALDIEEHDALAAAAGTSARP